MKINKNTTYEYIYNIISKPKTKIFIYKLFQKLVKYNKIDIFTKLCKNSTKFSKSVSNFFETLLNANGYNVKNINIDYIIKYTYYYKNINIFILFVNTFLDYKTRMNCDIAIKKSMISILYSLFTYIKKKKSSFYKICINKIATTFPLKSYYFNGECNYPSFFKLIDIYYINNGKIKYRNYFYSGDIVEINKIDILKFKTSTYKNLEYITYVYLWYKQHELGHIESIDFKKIIDTQTLFKDGSPKIDYIIAILFIFTLSYSINYNNICIFSTFVDFLLSNTNYIHFDIIVILFFKYFPYVKDGILPLKNIELNTMSTKSYSNIIFKLINNTTMLNDIFANISIYKLHIHKFLTNAHKNSKNKIFLSIKDMLIKSNITNTIEYTEVTNNIL